MVKINKPNNYKNVIEAIKEVCGIEYGFQANWKGIIDALDMCKGKGDAVLEVNNLIAGTGITLDPAHGDLKQSDITISAGGEDLFCDDCFTFCESYGQTRGGAFSTNTNTTVVKFSSDSCGACIRMAHYDSKVAAELGHTFVKVTTKDEEWHTYQYLLEEVCPDPTKVGFPTYVIAQGDDPRALSVVGSIRGGLDKGTFRKRLSGVAVEVESKASDECKGGSQEDYGKFCAGTNPPKNCDDFEWDCRPRSVKLCAGGCYTVTANTHGCDSSACVGDDLEYRWLVSEPGQQKYKVVQDWSRKTSITIYTAADAKIGKTYDGRVVARCNNFGGWSDKPNKNTTVETITADFTVTIKECGPSCPGSDWVELSGCPGNPKKPGTEVQLSANANGLANSAVTWDWFKGGTGGELIKSGGPNLTVTVPNKEGNTQKYTVRGTWNDDSNCKATAECILEAKVMQQCSANSDCPAGEECKNGECVPKEPPPECSANKDCPPCFICSNGKCVSKCGTGEICEDGTCVKKECTNDKDCPGDQICENGKCVDPDPTNPPPPPPPGGCNTDKDCPGDQICENGTCVDPPPGCTDDIYCPGEQICVNGDCVTIDPCDYIKCEDDEVCVEGECVKKICVDNGCNGGWTVDWNCVKTKLGI